MVFESKNGKSAPSSVLFFFLHLFAFYEIVNAGHADNNIRSHNIDNSRDLHLNIRHPAHIQWRT